jgi:DNA mismatch endonuclease (patch repair protein)
MKKIDSNVKRDKMVDDQLQKEGWEVIRIWEHEIRKEPDYIIKKIISSLK